jgi:hypothetical protein
MRESEERVIERSTCFVQNSLRICGEHHPISQEILGQIARSGFSSGFRVEEFHNLKERQIGTLKFAHPA